jgi:hypothetical protein
MSALDKQVNGNHYKQFIIQPIEFITKNNLGFIEGNVIKYICRHPFKDHVNDVEKVIHYCELLKELTYGEKKKNDLEQVVEQVATSEENSAAALAELVLNHPVGGLIFKRILNQLLTDRLQETEDAINQVVFEHPRVNEKSNLLDILEND